MTARDLPQRDAIRTRLRRRRRELSPDEQRRSGYAALRQLLTLIRLRRGLHIAVYLPAGGELDTAPLIELARRRGCHVYVPIVDRTTSRAVGGQGGQKRAHTRAIMRFVPLEPPLKRNRLGILEPLFSPHKARNPRTLDAVVMPLVAFGPHGARLGSGAGFYDQTFAFLRRRNAWRKPRLIGYGYHWQEVPTLANEAWDVPMNAVATDRETHRYGASKG